ncbi:hypothetical protein AQUCO_00100771v1 [Aquilegia coerulea]|uniref:Uncharacterized protein n=1 Tax=Aquilegia coerulea TaxID=218851 RepID=A0A2G5FBV6_AQUCA|nr:hypothetical protein AQUCO_00100771v1 [Aquilegia coerulea]
MKAQGIDVNRLMFLNRIRGAFRPGTLTALMSVSGAGESVRPPDERFSWKKTGGYRRHHQYSRQSKK